MKTHLDVDQIRVAQAIAAGNAETVNSVAWLYIKYQVYRVIFFFTTPANLFSSIAIGHYYNGYVGWSLFLFNILLSVTKTWVHVILTVCMGLFAAALYSN